mmetsp:Transcript_78518/g.177326  ORF Transcript_78518/g.177326 Transcript_78518/m.177326 type:complete len:151 (-) Transcript_78518:107-559(-)
MSRSTYGAVWHQAGMRPNFIGNMTGEVHPKRTPASGCGFSGVPGDFPPGKLSWYKRGEPGEDMRGSVFCQGNRQMPVGKAFQRSASTPSLSPARTPTRAELPGGMASFDLPPFDSRLSRRRAAPETLRHAGVSTFEFRRFHETNSAMPAI